MNAQGVWQASSLAISGAPGPIAVGEMNVVSNTSASVTGHEPVTLADFPRR